MFANPVSCSARLSHAPLSSPVNIRPVRFAPCAPGASPTSSTRASGSPNPGIGFPQYSSFAYFRFLTCATSSLHSTSRGQSGTARDAPVQGREPRTGHPFFQRSHADLTSALQPQEPCRAHPRSTGSSSVPSFNAVIFPSSPARSPTSTIAIFAGSMYFFATRCTSADRHRQDAAAHTAR